MTIISKLAVLAILALLAIGVLSLMTGDTTLMDIFFTVFQAH